MKSMLVGTLVIAVAVAPFALAQPSARSGHVMAYDANRGLVVLFGGYDATRYSNETWHWDGSSWWKLPDGGPSGPPRPAGRSGAMMAYDASRQVVVLFGGYDGTNDLDDTWEYSSSGWSEMDPNDHPHARRQGAMAYSGSGVVMLFGGRFLVWPGMYYLDDTWEWDGTNWEEQDPNDRPMDRWGNAMAYDCSVGVDVLFGGSMGGGETWEWDGTDWSIITFDPNDATPGVRKYHAMSFDTNDSRVVLFGGLGFTCCSDTWEYDAENDEWYYQDVETHPSGRYNHAMAYDSENAVTVLFGGWDCGDYLGDTWTYDGDSWTEEE
jgi:hypothetical protein